MAERHYHTAEPIAEILERLSRPTESGCWAWLGKTGTGGYAYINYRIGPQRRLTRKAATVAWELANARERPEGLEIDHICRTRWCVNPDHLRLATRSENSLNRAPYRYVPNCNHCGKPKIHKSGWNPPGWYCEDTNRKEHHKLVSANKGIPLGRALKSRGKNGPK
jgi:hypothetical protein